MIEYKIPIWLLYSVDLRKDLGRVKLKINPKYVDRPEWLNFRK